MAKYLGVSGNYYQILGVGPKASPDEIRAAYKKLALKYHPDVNQGSKESEERFKEVLEAYQTLSDPQKKDLYDLRLFYRAFTQGGESARPSGGQPDPVYRGTPRTGYERERADYRRRQQDRQAYREYRGPAESNHLTLHTVALTLLVLGSFAMISLWFGWMMNKYTARQALEQGQYQRALELDDEYGEAYYARFKARQGIMASESRLLLKDLSLAIRYTDEIPGMWYLERSRLYFKLDSLPRCEADIKAAIVTDPSLDSAWLAMGDFQLFTLEKPAVALVYFDSCLKIRPNSFEAQYGKGLSHYKLKQFVPSITAFSRCLDQSPDVGQLFFLRGSAELALGRKKEACIDLDQALNLGVDEAKPLVDAYCLKELGIEQ